MNADPIAHLKGGADINSQSDGPTIKSGYVSGAPFVPPPMSEERIRLKAKLCSVNLSNQSVQAFANGSGQQPLPNSEESQQRMETPRAAPTAPEQTSAGALTRDSSAIKPANPKSAKAKPYIEEFALPAASTNLGEANAADAPDSERGAPDKFPITEFPEAIQEIAKQLADVYQAPICVPAMCMLATLSAAVGKSVVVTHALRDHVTTVNIYVMVVAERGTCKSVVGYKTTEPMHAFSEQLVIDHRKKVAAQKTELAVLKKEAARLESDAGKAVGAARNELIANLTRKNERIAELEADADRQVTAIEADITGEALVRSLEDNHETIFSYSPEAGAVVSVTAGKYRDGKADIDGYLCGYSGDPLRATRVDRGSVVVSKPCLTLLWLMQGVVAYDLLGNRDTIPRGFTARTLFFDSGARREYDNRKDDSFTMADKWADMLRLQLCRRQLNQPPKEIKCSPEAREVFAKFHDEGVDLERTWCPDLSGEFSRQRENAIRISGLFALVEGRDAISEEIATRAVSVVRWVGFNYCGLIHIERKKRLKRDFDRILEILHEAGGAIGLGPLAQYHGIKREKVEALIAVYPESLAINKTPQPAGQAGRPAEMLVLASSPTPVGPTGNKIEKIEKLSGGSAAA